MKIYKPLLSICLAMVAVIFVPAMNAASDKVDTDEEMLRRIEAEFDAASEENRFAIVSRHIGEAQIADKEYASENTLSLAIRLGYIRMVEKFLKVEKLDINSDELYIWGYRQLYSIAHVALDPTEYCDDSVPLYRRLSIIDLIAEMGANFDWVPPFGAYNNPPLSAGEPRGSHSQHMDALRARALLWGADPCLKGSSFLGLEKNMGVFELALNQLYDLAEIGVKVKPTEHTIKMMKDIAKEREAAHKALFA